MVEATLEPRVKYLEDLMAQLLRAQARTQEQVEQTSRELREFKVEMRGFKDEMRGFKDEMRGFKDEMHDSNQEMKRRWGELANKMGTMAEDLVAPSIPRILRTAVDCPDDAIEHVAVRVQQRHPETRQMQEFDVLAACGDYVLINETKSSLSPEHVTEFVGLLERAREFFPEYAGKKFIGAIASLYVDPSLVRFGERQGLIVLGFGEDLMDVLNSPEFTPREF